MRCAIPVPTNYQTHQNRTYITHVQLVKYQVIDMLVCYLQFIFSRYASVNWIGSKIKSLDRWIVINIFDRLNRRRFVQPLRLTSIRIKLRRNRMR